MATDKHGEKITFRVDDEMKAKATTVMKRRGILKLSDFARQAVQREIERIEAELELEEARISMIKETLADELKGPQTPPKFGELRELPPAKKSPSPAGGHAGAGHAAVPKPPATG